MDEYDKKPEDSGEDKAVEITPELQVELDRIRIENNQISDNKKIDKKIKPMLTAIIVLLLISGTAIALTVVKGGNGNGGKKDDGIVKDEPLEITTYEKKDLYNKIALLNFTNTESNKEFVETGIFKSSAFMYSSTPKLYMNQGYNENQKLYALLHTARYYDKKFEKVTDSSYKEADFEKYMKDNVYTSNWTAVKEHVLVLSAEYVENHYEEIYGEKLNHQSVKENCGTYLYDSNLGIYIADLYGGCGGYDFRSVNMRVFSIASTTEEYFVDVNAVTMYTNSIIEEDNKCVIYNDVYDLRDNNMEKNIYKSCEFNEDGGTDFVFTDSDINSVAKYRFTFDKDRHFKSIKKL